LRNSKRYYLIKHLIKQYDRLHAESEKARQNAISHNGIYNFHKEYLRCRKLQTIAEWVLQVADKLVDKQVVENENEKVVFT